MKRPSREIGTVNDMTPFREIPAAMQLDRTRPMFAVFHSRDVGKHPSENKNGHALQTAVYIKVPQKT